MPGKIVRALDVELGKEIVEDAAGIVVRHKVTV